MPVICEKRRVLDRANPLGGGGDLSDFDLVKFLVIEGMRYLRDSHTSIGKGK